MNVQELIIGHYEQSLTPEQEGQLSMMLDESPEARALYQQHGRIHSMMVGEAEIIQPSRKLEKAVVAAALGAAVEIGGQAAGISFAGKIIAAATAVVVGGISVGIIMNSGDDPKPESPGAQTPAVKNIPPALPIPTPIESTGTDAAEVEPVTEKPNDVQQPAGSAPSGTRPGTKPNAAPSNGQGGANGQGGEIDLGDEGETIIRDSTKIDPKRNR